jgi:hypothetical protein
MTSYPDFVLFAIAVCVFALVPTIPIIVIVSLRKINKRRRR